MFRSFAGRLSKARRNRLPKVEVNVVEDPACAGFFFARSELHLLELFANIAPVASGSTEATPV